MLVILVGGTIIFVALHFILDSLLFQSEIETVSVPDSAVQYLVEHSESINLDDESFNLQILEPYLEQNEFFLMGIAYGCAYNHEISFKLLKYLYHHADVRYYVAEISYSGAQLLNRYLGTGDEGILAELFDNCKGTLFWTQENYNLWKKLHEFNKSLPQDERITVIGRDLEQVPALTFQYLRTLLPDEEPPAEIAEEINSIKAVYSVDKRFAVVATKLQQALEDHDALFRDYLKNQYQEFVRVVDNMARTVEFIESRDYNLRSEHGYQFLKQCYLARRGNFYGQCSDFDVMQRKPADSEVQPLAALLNQEDSRFAGKVLSIKCFYRSSKLLTAGRYGTYDTRKFSTITYDTKATGLEIKQPVIFDLQAKGSPFREQALMVPEGATTDYYQMMIIIQGSPAETPLETSK